MFFTSLSSKISAIVYHFPSKIISYSFLSMSTDDIHFSLASEEPPKEATSFKRSIEQPPKHFIHDSFENGPAEQPKRSYEMSNSRDHPQPVRPTPPQNVDVVQRWFSALETKTASHAGKITAKDLQQAFQIFQEPQKEREIKEALKRLPMRTVQTGATVLRLDSRDPTSAEGEHLRRMYGDPVGVLSDSARPVKKLPPIHSEVNKWFETVDGRSSGKISAKELQQAFEIFQGRHFSESACKFVVRLFDLDKTGGLDVREFEQLYFYVKQWVNAFNAYDRERAGYLGEKELDYALKYMDINFSPEFIKFLIMRCDPKNKKISLDHFIMTCIQIQRYTDEFKARDDNYTGVINIKYEDFLEMILRCL